MCSSLKQGLTTILQTKALMVPELKSISDFIKISNIKDHTSILIYIYMTECKLCDQTNPIIADISKSANYRVYKINITNCSELVIPYDIRGIPTSLIFNKGVFIRSYTGPDVSELIVENSLLRKD